MPPDPADYDVTPEMLRVRMNLFNSDIEIFPTGIEFMFDDVTTKALTNCYDKTALLLRTTPDFLLKEGTQTYFVEAKQRTTSIEAIGLYFNKLKERNGIKVLYSFPSVTINASMIPMGEIQIPQKHRDDFDRYLKDLFVTEGCTFDYWKGNPPSGSGDPFVRIDESDLIELSGGNL